MRRPENLKLKYILEKMTLCDVWKLFSYVFLWRWKSKGLVVLKFERCKGVIKFYKQLQGAAMGSPVSTVIANIYMEYFESLVIPSSPTLIKWWFRYVDDVHSDTRKDQVDKLQEHLNSIDPHIKFTIELPGTDGLPFLDTLTKPTPNSTESTVYTKPTPTDRYLRLQL